MLKKVSLFFHPGLSNNLGARMRAISAALSLVGDIVSWGIEQTTRTDLSAGQARNPIPEEHTGALWKYCDACKTLGNGHRSLWLRSYRLEARMEPLGNDALWVTINYFARGKKECIGKLDFQVSHQGLPGGVGSSMPVS